MIEAKSRAWFTCPQWSRSTTQIVNNAPANPLRTRVSHRVAVVIPNWNGERFLNTCLNALRRQSFRDFETDLVDNDSTDDSVGFVAHDFPEVRILSLEENRGFSAAVNAGIVASGAQEYVALL